MLHRCRRFRQRRASCFRAGAMPALFRPEEAWRTRDGKGSAAGDSARGGCMLPRRAYYYLTRYKAAIYFYRIPVRTGTAVTRARVDGRPVMYSASTGGGDAAARNKKVARSCLEDIAGISHIVCGSLDGRIMLLRCDKLRIFLPFAEAHAKNGWRLRGAHALYSRWNVA